MNLTKLSELLEVLSKHNVTEFESEEMGVKLKTSLPFVPTPWSLSGAPAVGEKVGEEEDTAPKTDPPPPGAVEPIPYDMDDVLHGAK